MARSQQGPLKLSLFGHFGSLNSGNESTLTSILTHMRELPIDVELCCICTNPAAVSARDGIKAVPITTRARPPRDDARSPGGRLGDAARTAVAELAQFAHACRTLGGTDVLIVPGTGLVTDAFGLHSWGPYNMFKWVLAARLRRARVLFVSIGAGPFYSRVGRLLVKASLFLADYRSYRDDASRDSLREIGFPADLDPVYPDLVFGLPETLLPSSAERPRRARPVVGIGLMAYPGWYSAADPLPETYTTYLEAMTTLAGWLLDHGYDIRLLFGDAEGDLEVLAEFKQLLRERIGEYDEHRVTEQPPTSQDVLGELADTDVVVATRFHNVLLSMLLTKPVLAISFHHKCSSLMKQMQLSDYCHDIHHIDADRMIEQFQSLELNREAVQRTIEVGVGAARSALDRQYATLFAAA